MKMVLLVVPLLCACGASWQDEYRKAAAALKADQFDLAEQYLNSALSIAGNQKNQEGVAFATLGLARAHMEQGEYGQARPLFEQVLKQFESLKGRRSPAVAETLVELSACLYSQQLFAQAEPLCLEAVKIELELPQKNIGTLGTAYNNLAEICKRRGEDDPAESYYRKAIDVYKGSDKYIQNAVETYCNLAMLYKRQERYLLARETVDAALSLQKQQKQQNDLALAAVLNTVASIDRAQFDSEAARGHYQEAVKLLMAHAHKGAEFEESLCDTLDNLADLQMDERELEEAEQVYKDSIQHCIESRGANHPCVAERMVDLANLYRDTQKYAQAEDLLNKGLAIYSASYDSESPIVINTINDLSAVYVDQKKFAQADRLYEDWLPRLEKELGPHHPTVADAWDNWGVVAEAADDKKRSQELHARAKGIRVALTQKRQ